jgi:hypothetical protein
MYLINDKVNHIDDHSAVSKSKSTIITNDIEVKKTKDYETIKIVISRLVESGITRMGEGYCISVSDIIFNLLTQYGIKSHLQECQLSIVDQTTKNTHLVGFETAFHKSTHLKVAAHVVVVTDTEIPIFIDASIAHKLPSGMQVIVDKFENYNDKVFGKVEYDGYNFIYQEKITGLAIPQLHQISILNRIQTDKKIFNEIKILKILNYIGIFLSSFAMLNIIIKFFQ